MHCFTSFTAIKYSSIGDDCKDVVDRIIANLINVR